jgi:hypothetical protein
MDVLAELRFLLNLLETTRTLVRGYGTAAPNPNTFTVRGHVKIETTLTVKDEAFIGLLWRRIYGTTFPGIDSGDPLVADLVDAFNRMKSG